MEGGNFDNFPEEGMRQLGLGDIHPPERGGEDAASDAPTEGEEGMDQVHTAEAPEQKVGDINTITFDQLVEKEIMELGEGFKNPKMNSVVTIDYKLYFFDHTPIEEGTAVKLSLGDIAWPEGLWKSIQAMRKGELAKIRIKKKKYGFGRKEKRDNLRIPKGFELPSPDHEQTEEGKAQLERHQRLFKKGIIYEVRLLGWVDRTDIDGNGNFLKTFLQEAPKKEWEKPAEVDEVKVSAYLSLTENDPALAESQEDIQYLIEKPEWETNLADPMLPWTVRKVIETMKRGEQCSVLIKRTYVKEENPEFWAHIQELQGEADLSDTGFFLLTLELHTLIKVQDFYKDGTTFKRILRKGKGDQPNSDSVVKMFMKITVNDEEKISNFPIEVDPAQVFEGLSDEDRKVLEADEDRKLYTFSFDQYTLPKVIRKVVRSMKKGEICELKTNQVTKLCTNFPNEVFDQYKLFKEGDKVSIHLGLVWISKDEYFYQQTVTRKLERIQHLKGIAGQFFKAGDFLKAARIYQKINGYYNFGDSTNNYQKEDDASEEYRKTFGELLSLKLVCFLNLVVCKHKLKDWQSIVGITDQILEMDPSNVKCLYFRGNALLELQEHARSVECLVKLVLIDPKHADGRSLFEKAKKVKKEFQEAQHKKFSKFFS